METKAGRAYVKPHVQRFGTFRDITNEGSIVGIERGLALSPDGSTAILGSPTVLRESR